ncbi:heparan N-sulfatase [Adhaeribacter arboris]|uniref:Heparan N-sulfatase n=1 Tax=Adhaeribacter arboris TaxID=2072846 RepID=A0A2T2YGU1_9BACT|nr:sulfatase [Adhaeribacter arboris]PSR54737.1 heparan N-sulfatase [Adhaeribacter arboris]
MKKWIVLISHILFCFLPAQAKKLPAKPNIVFIIGDDISPEDIGAYGNSKIRTPNLNKLAKDGLKFRNMYVTSSSCSPSRVSVLTGRYPHNTGAAELHSPVPAHLTLFPEQLRKAGYYTAQAGKWHEGPVSRRAYDTLLAGEQMNGPGGEEQWLNLLRNRPKKKPFFLWLAPFDAHREWSADNFRQPHNPDTEVTIPPTLVDTKETRQDLASYYNEISRIDYYLGELEKELQRQGVAQNTIIIFMADNGRPFPGSKTLLYDRGIKSPFLMKWPAAIKNKGVEVEALVSSIDIAPTLFALAGAPSSPTIQGKSFVKLLDHPQAAFRNYIFAEHNWHDYEAYERAVRSKDFLYILNLRPEFNNGGPIDANQSPASKALKLAKTKGTLTPLQNEALVKPRPAEEFFVNAPDSLQQHNEINNPAYAKQFSSLKSILQQWQKQTCDTAPEKLTPDWYHRETGQPLPAKDTRGEMPGAALHADRINAKGPF